MTNSAFINRVIDFFKKLVRKENIPIIIYFLVNILLMFFGNTLVIEAIFGTTDQTSMLISVPVSIVLYGLGVCLALSPAGEWMLRKKTGCKEIEDEETAARLNPIFDEVFAKAKAVNPDIPDDVHLYICHDDDVNAFAVGRKTICVTEGALALPDDQLKGVMGHEFGHISNHDTDLSLVVNVANWFVTAYFIAIKIYIHTVRIFGKVTSVIMALVSTTLGDFLTNIILGTVIDILSLVFLTLASALWTAFGNLLIKASTRGNEYLADNFSKELGYGESLVSFLSGIDSGRRKLSFFKRVTAVLSDTHPAPEKRVENLRK